MHTYCLKLVPPFQVQRRRAVSGLQNAQVFEEDNIDVPPTLLVSSLKAQQDAARSSVDFLPCPRTQESYIHSKLQAYLITVARRPAIPTVPARNHPNFLAFLCAGWTAGPRRLVRDCQKPGTDDVELSITYLGGVDNPITRVWVRAKGRRVGNPSEKPLRFEVDVLWHGWSGLVRVPRLLQVNLAEYL